MKRLWDIHLLLLILHSLLEAVTSQVNPGLCKHIFVCALSALRLLFLGSVLVSKLQLIHMLDPLWDTWSRLSLGWPFHAFLPLSVLCTGGSNMRRMLSNKNQNEVLGYCWNCANTSVIFQQRNCAVYEGGCKLSSSPVCIFAWIIIKDNLTTSL